MAESKRILIKIDVTEKNASANIRKTKKAVDDLASSTERLATATKRSKTNTGLNNAIIAESARLASDASYGFTAMANNLGQLVNLFKASKDAAGSYSDAFKALLTRQSLFFIGLQLLITFLPKLIKSLSDYINQVDALTEAQRKGTLSFQEQVSNLNSYLTKLKDANTSDDQRRKLIQNINNEYDDLNLKLNENNELTEESNRIVNTYIEVLKIRAQAEATLALIQEKTIEKTKLFNQGLLESVSLKSAVLGLFKQVGNPTTGMGFVGAVADDTAGRVKKLDDEIDKLIKSLVVAGVDKDTKKGIERRLRLFLSGQFDLARIRERFINEANKIEDVNYEERLDREEEYQKRLIDIQAESFLRREKERLKRYIDQTKKNVKNVTKRNQLIADAEAKFAAKEIEVREEVESTKEQITNAYITKRILAKDKEAKAVAKIEREIQNAEIEQLRYSLDANQEYYAAKQSQLEQDIENQRLALATNKMTAQEEAQLRKDILNNQIELQKGLLQAKLDRIEEEKRIDLEYVGFAQGIGQLMRTLADENEALQKAALIIEKGAAIADVVINTQSANQGIRAGYALKAAFAPPGLNAKFIAQGEAQIARNNIGAGIAIANILATTLMSFKKPSKGGGGAGDVSVEAPDFNVVGASPESQLAQTVAGQQSKPLKAFVVGKEITSQQELDRNITTNASLGD